MQICLLGRLRIRWGGEAMTQPWKGIPTRVRRNGADTYLPLRGVCAEEK